MNAISKQDHNLASTAKTVHVLQEQLDECPPSPDLLSVKFFATLTENNKEAVLGQIHCNCNQQNIWCKISQLYNKYSHI